MDACQPLDAHLARIGPAMGDVAREALGEIRHGPDSGSSRRAWRHGRPGGRYARAVRGLALAAGFSVLVAAGAARSEPIPFDGAKATVLAHQLVAATDALYDAFYKQPRPPATPRSARDYDRLKRDIRRIRSQARGLEADLARGESREETPPGVREPDGDGALGARAGAVGVHHPGRRGARAGGARSPTTSSRPSTSAAHERGRAPGAAPRGADPARQPEPAPARLLRRARVRDARTSTASPRARCASSATTSARCPACRRATTSCAAPSTSSGSPGARSSCGRSRSARRCAAQGVVVDADLRPPAPLRDRRRELPRRLQRLALRARPRERPLAHAARSELDRLAELRARRHAAALRPLARLVPRRGGLPRPAHDGDRRALARGGGRPPRALLPVRRRVRPARALRHPEPWASRYDPDWEGPHLIWPPYVDGGAAARGAERAAGAPAARLLRREALDDRPLARPRARRASRTPASRRTPPCS